MTSLLLIRADAGGVLGTGHVMRMLALAQAWQECGGSAVMATITCPKLLVERLKQEGVAFQSLPVAELGRKEDLQQTLAAAEALRPEWIVLDGYHFDVEYQRAIRKAGFKVMVMDDYGHCETWCADLILNQNIDTEGRTYPNEVGEGRIARGLAYALFRREFWNADANIPVRDPMAPIENILVTLGGVDPDNVTGRVLDLLEIVTVVQLNVRVLIGAGNPHFTLLQEQASHASHHIQLIRNATEMPSLYSWADGVISAGGSTCYEWLLYGLRGAVVTLAENQQTVVRGLSKRTLALDLGWWHTLSREGNSSEINKWVNGANARERGKKLVDAWGGHRVAAAISGASFWMRRARPGDAKSYFELANESDVRRNAFSSEPIQWNDHIQWFHGKLHSESSVLYAAFVGERAFVGQVRFDFSIKERAWLVDYSLIPDFRGKGWGRELLREAIRRMIRIVHSPLLLRARVKADNPASSAIFNRLGFKQRWEANSGEVLVFDLSIT